MQNGHLIPADQFCIHHNIELSFLGSLQQYGLIQITTAEETSFIPEDTLPDLERIMRLHYELDINLEGIEAIVHLLQRVEALQDEVRSLKSKLRLYEQGS